MLQRVLPLIHIPLLAGAAAGGGNSRQGHGRGAAGRGVSEGAQRPAPKFEARHAGRQLAGGSQALRWPASTAPAAPPPPTPPPLPPQAPTGPAFYALVAGVVGLKQVFQGADEGVSQVSAARRAGQGRAGSGRQAGGQVGRAGQTGGQGRGAGQGGRGQARACARRLGQRCAAKLREPGLYASATPSKHPDTRQAGILAA